MGVGYDFSPVGEDCDTHLVFSRNRHAIGFHDRWPKPSFMFLYANYMRILNHLYQRSLAHVIRFSAWPQHFPESVAEHSFFTAYFVSVLLYLLRKEHIEIDGEKALQMALIHDMEEVFSGDILGPFKHYSAELNEAIRRVNEETIKQVFRDLPEQLQSKYIALWQEEGQGNSIEAQVVKLADKLSLLSKCAEEIKAGNQYIEQIYEENYRNLQEFKAPWWDAIRSQIMDN